MNINWKTMLWWAFLAGIGFTIGAGLAKVVYLMLVWGLRIDLVLPWLGNVATGQA